MAELTREQLEKAKRAYYGALDGIDPCAYLVESVENALRAAAPHLQLPWDMVITDAEADHYGSMYRAHTGIQIDQAVLRHILASLIANRNAAIQPKPVDFRRQVIATELAALGVDVLVGFKAADKILAALDEVK